MPLMMPMQWQMKPLCRPSALSKSIYTPKMPKEKMPDESNVEHKVMVSKPGSLNRSTIDQEIQQQVNSNFEGLRKAQIIMFVLCGIVLLYI